MLMKKWVAKPRQETSNSLSIVLPSSISMIRLTKPNQTIYGVWSLDDRVIAKTRENNEQYVALCGMRELRFLYSRTQMLNVT
jgi:hypothetical protein